MKVIIDSRHFDVDTKLRSYIEKKCNKLDQFFDRIISGNVILKLESKHKIKEKVVEFEVNVPGKSLFCKEKGLSFESALNNAIDTMSRQIKKHKEKRNQFA